MTGWPRREAHKKRDKRFLTFYFMMLPGILYLLINNYIPMAGIIIAFKRLNFRQGIWNSPWVGFKNFKFLFLSSDAYIISRNTILYNGVFILLGTLMAVAIAVLLDELKCKFTRQFSQTVILIPYLISMVVASYLVNALLSTDNGFINKSILEPIGFSPVSWYASKKVWPYIITIVYLWKNFGYQSIIYYATEVGIDRGLYEAASIDGASRWQKIKSITLPGLKSTIITMILLSVGRIFYSDFGLFYQVPMNSGALFDVTNTIDTYVYRGLLKNNNLSMSSAASVYQSLVGFVLILAANSIIRKISKEDVLF